MKLPENPIIGIISTGDEVIPPEKQLLPGQVWDINSYSVSALIEQTGAIPKKFGVFPDQVDILEGICFKAIDECDALIITAGSSASSRDLTAGVINKLGSPGVLVHGVNIRPGKPTILAICNNKVVIGLPGIPVSALVIAGLFVVPVIESMLGLNNVGFRPHFLARLSNNIPSQAGRARRQPDFAR